MSHKNKNTETFNYSQLYCVNPLFKESQIRICLLIREDSHIVKFNCIIDPLLLNVKIYSSYNNDLLGSFYKAHASSHCEDAIPFYIRVVTHHRYIKFQLTKK